MIFYLYYLIDPRDNLPFYVGYTKAEKHRLKRHIREVKQFEKHGKCESNNLMKVGVIRQILDSGSSPVLEIKNQTEDFEEVKRFEIDHIAKYGLRILNTGILTNMTLGGEGSLGKKKSKEELDRRAATRRARSGGVWHSEETKETLSKVRKGYKTGKPSWNSGLTKETNASIAAMADKNAGKTPWNKKDKNEN